MGLVSDGGVHSSIDHLLGLTELLKENNLDDRVYIHAFMDGRDTDPRSGKDFIKHLQNVGFKSCTHIPLTFGIVDLYVAIKE